MPKFNPDFWETTIDAGSWERLSNADALWYHDAEEAEFRDRRAERSAQLLPAILEIVDEVLTERQREVVLLYFVEELNQAAIGGRLGISQQAVSEHLYGKVRNGRAVGGALRKLRKACAQRGVRWE